MAAVIEGDVRKNLLDRTDAEKVFRPWWDLIEDYLLNTLIGLGEKKILKNSIGLDNSRMSSSEPSRNRVNGELSLAIYQ